MAKPIKILLVEDDIIIAENMKEMMYDLGYENVFVSYSYDEAVQDFKKIKPDIGIFDIQIGHESLDGLDLIKKLLEIYEFPFIVLSAYIDEAYQSKAFALKPATYLVKPVSEAQLKVALNSIEMSFYADENLLNGSKNYFFCKIDDRNVKFYFDDVFFIEAFGSYCILHTHNQSFTLSLNLGQMLEKIKRHESFVRCHRSYIVNIDKIVAHNLQHIFIKTEDKEHSIPYSDGFKKSIKNLLY